MDRHRSSYREPLSARFWLGLAAMSLTTGAIAFVMVPGSGSGESAPTPAMPAAEAPVDVAAIKASVTYSGCREVRAAGAAPLYRGTPGYRTTMDDDGDGIACEPVR